MKYPQGIFTFQRPFRVINFSTTAVFNQYAHYNTI